MPSTRKVVPRSVVLALALMATILPAPAEVPMLLNYQGRLLDAAGNPRNGSFTMQFAIYGAEIGGGALPSSTPWDETQTVTVTNGTFNVLLGSATPLPPDLFTGPPADAVGPARYLQTTVNGEVLAPRQRIVSGAYSLESPDILVVDANGQRVGKVLSLSGSVEILASIDGHSLTMKVHPEEGQLPQQGSLVPGVYFTSNDCSGPAYIPTEAHIFNSQVLVTNVPDAALGPPGMTAYLPNLSITTTLTANSFFSSSPCETTSETGDFHPATPVALLDTPGARWTKPFRLVYP